MLQTWQHWRDAGDVKVLNSNALRSTGSLRTETLNSRSSFAKLMRQMGDETAGERLPEQRPHSIEENKDPARAQEIERRNTTSSSMNTRRRGVSALIEHRRQDDWTYTPCTCGRSGCSGGFDVLAGERLPKQRPQGEEHPEHKN